MTAHETVTAMIAPALFLTATGSLIISTANRMGRVVDRMRAMLERADEISRDAANKYDFHAERLGRIDSEIERLRLRSRLSLVAVTRLYLAFGLFVSTSLLIALDSFLDGRLRLGPALLAVCGVGMLLLASISLVREARTALRGHAGDVAFYKGLRDKRLNPAEPEA